MKKFPKTCVALAMLCSAPAFAESAFQGFHAQVSAGYEQTSFSNINPSWENTTLGFLSGRGAADRKDRDDAQLVFGAAYYREVQDKVLLGLGFDYSALSRETGNFSHRSTNNMGIGFEMGNMSYKASNQINAYLSAGYAVSRDKLAYLKFGYSSMLLEYAQGADPDILLLSGFSSSKRVDGYVAGIGYKQIVGNGFYAFAEANYAAYEKSSLQGNAVAAGANNIRLTSAPSVSTYNVLVGLGYTF